MGTHSSTLAWRIPWTEEPGGLQPTGSHRVRRDEVNKQPDQQPLLLTPDRAAELQVGPVPASGKLQDYKHIGCRVTVSGTVFRTNTHPGWAMSQAAKLMRAGGRVRVSPSLKHGGILNVISRN